MFRTTLLIAALGVGTLGSTASCVGSAEVGVAATVPAHQLVWIAPGIWVVEDYPYSVYYYDDYYWRVIDGAWYRSPYYTGGWVRIGYAPRPIVRVYRPRRYRHYRAPARARRRAIRDRRSPRARPRTRSRAEPRARPRTRSRPERRRRR